MTRVSAIASRVRHLGIAVAVLVAASGAFETIGAQVYEWTDNNGDRHFATSPEQLPDEARDKARVVVNAAPRAEAPSDVITSTTPQPNANDGERDTLFASGWDAGFGAGWQAGYRAAAEEQPECQAQPQVVVLQSQPPIVNVPLNDPSGAYYRPPNTLSVPFDDGQSMGLTSRGLMMQQRAIERGW